MINTLSNKLFQFEMVKRERKNLTFLFWLATDIIELLRKVTESGLEYSLTPHEREVIEDVKFCYEQYSKIFLKIAG